MQVLFACPRPDADVWLCELQAALPAATFSIWNPDGPPSGATMALVWQPPVSLFEHETALKTVFNLGAGVDALLANPALPAHIDVVRLEDAGMAAQMTEYVIYAINRVIRNLGRYDEQKTRTEWRPLDEEPRAAWPVGVLGQGVVGARVARTLAELGYDVAGWSRNPKTVQGVHSFHGDAALPDFLSRTRILVNVLPATPDTHRLIDRKLLDQLRPDGMVINVGRGASLVQDDLLAALDSAQVRAAALDVFEQEPLDPAHPLWSHPRVAITPHIAARTLRGETIRQIAGKVERLARGEAITGVVDRKRGY